MLLTGTLTPVRNRHGRDQSDTTEHRIKPLHVREQLQTLHAGRQNIDRKYRTPDIEAPRSDLGRTEKHRGERGEKERPCSAA